MDLLRYVYALPKSVELRKAEGGIRGEWAIPADAVPDKVILYSHGGAYISGSPSTHEPIICRLAEQSHIPVFAYPYRLAPENPFPAALEDARAGGDLFTGAGLCTGRIWYSAGIRLAED